MTSNGVTSFAHRSTSTGRVSATRSCMPDGRRRAMHAAQTQAVGISCSPPVRVFKRVCAPAACDPGLWMRSIDELLTHVVPEYEHESRETFLLCTAAMLS